MKRILPFSKTAHPFTFMLIIGLLTALVSEIKILPFDGASFRFGLGSIIFFLGILVRPVPILQTGIVTALIVWLFRTMMSFMFSPASFMLFEHIPAALFYIAFASGLHFISIQQLRVKPFKLGLYGAFFEVIGNTIEQLSITLFFAESFMSLRDLGLLLAVAFLRSYFAVGLFSAIAMSEQKKRTEQLLLISADLYVETLYIQKSMDNIERITSDGFTLYQQLKEIDANLGMKALMLAQEIHEVKKDSERIYAGLSKIVTAKRAETYELAELLQFVFEANAKYAESLGKDIQFDITWQESFALKEPLSILAILNNLIANAIEAIPQQGTIHLHVSQDVTSTHFIVENDGPMIPSSDLPVIFDPGYTTKFNNNGYASTGIGLSHVQAIVHQMQGTIKVSSEQATIFHLKIPNYTLC